MLEYGKVDQIFNLLTTEEHTELGKQFNGPKWDLGAGEVDYRKHGIPVRSFLYKELINEEWIKNLFYNKTKEIVKSDIEILRLYGNGQAHSQCGFIHNDDDTSDDIGSLVYYPDITWTPLMGGHLVFVDPNSSDVLYSIFPKGNSAAIFNSKMSHFALDPSPYCLDLRISIAVKFKVI
jgi:hypothetical protein